MMVSSQYVAHATTVRPAFFCHFAGAIVEVLIARLLAEDKPLVGLVQSDRGRALDQLAARRILLAGFHGDVPVEDVIIERAEVV